MSKNQPVSMRSGRRVQKLLYLLVIVTFTLLVLHYQSFLKISIEKWSSGKIEGSSPAQFFTARKSKAKLLRQFLYPNLTLIDLEAQYLINNDICSHFDATHLNQKPKNVFAITVYQSGSAYRGERDAIRQSMPVSELDRMNIKRLFFLARPNPHENSTQVLIKNLILENEAHRDLVVGDFIDHYRNLTYKTIMFLDWTARYCPQAQFVIKSDDDIIVDLYQLSHLLHRASDSSSTATSSVQQEQLDDDEDPASREFVSAIRQKLRNSPDNRFIMGSTLSFNKVERGKGDRFYVSYEQYPNETWPSYSAGMGYITTIKTAKDLVDMSKKVPFLWIEDAYVTGILREKAGIEFFSMESMTTYSPESVTCCSPTILMDSTQPDIQLDGYVGRKSSAPEEECPVRDFLQPRWCHYLFGQAQYGSSFVKTFQKHAKFCYDTESCVRPSFKEQLERCNGLFSTRNQ